MVFKINGNRYAVFSLDIKNITRVTDYVLALDEAEDLAENYEESEG